MGGDLRIDAKLRSRYGSRMIPPFDRERLKQRNALDVEQDALASAEKTSAERFEETIEVSELARELAFATGTAAAANDLETKARLFVRPLRVVMPP